MYGLGFGEGEVIVVGISDGLFVLAILVLLVILLDAVKHVLDAIDDGRSGGGVEWSRAAGVGKVSGEMSPRAATRHSDGSSIK